MTCWNCWLCFFTAVTSIGKTKISPSVRFFPVSETLHSFPKYRRTIQTSLFIRHYFFRAPKICYRKWVTNPPRHSCLTLSSSCSLRADRTSFTPARASARAKCSPIPLEAPVIHTTLPARESANIKYFIERHEEIHGAWDRICICISMQCSDKVLWTRQFIREFQKFLTSWVTWEKLTVKWWHSCFTLRRLQVQILAQRPTILILFWGHIRKIAKSGC